MRLALALVFGLFITAGCAPSLIPNTDIRDTAENHEILDVIVAYRGAVEKRDVTALMKLVSQGFYEDSGTAESSDDYDYAGLEKKLTNWAATTRSARVAIQVKNIFIEGDRARAQYFFDLNYQIPGPDNTLLWKRDSDSKEMTFRREGSAWRITGGI